MMNKFLPGNEYTRGPVKLRILAIHDGNALLEQWRDDTLIQYIVTHDLDMDGVWLIWHGSGKYFSCSPLGADSPYEAFIQAADALREHVYIVLADTDEGAWCEVCTSYDAALHSLEEALNANSKMVRLAEKLGHAPLTAACYIEHKQEFDSISKDYYSIDIDEILHNKE